MADNTGILERKFATKTDGTDPVLIVSRDQKGPRYSVSGTLTAALMATTDFAVLTGAANKTVRVRRIRVQGVATAGVQKSILVNRNITTVDTGGGSVAVTPAPFAAADAASTSTCKQYTANPTIGGTVTTLFKRGLVFAADTLPAGVVEWKFDDGKPPLLLSSTQELALNLNGEATTAGMVLYWEMDFEEATE